MYQSPPNVPFDQMPVGRCSVCKTGIVTVPKLWGSITPATPTCQNCGATQKPPTSVSPWDYLPEVDMVPSGKTQLNG